MEGITREEGRHPIVAEGVGKAFGSALALADVSFSAGRGEIVNVLGPNGAGKSTLLKMIAGLYKPTSGRTMVLGEDAYTLDTVKRERVSFLGENYALYDDLTCFENMKFFARLYRIRNFEAELGKLLRAFGASEYRDRKLGELSRGTKQKIALCRAFMNRPSVILLDEPSAFLDQRSSERLHGMLNRLARGGATILYATQRLEELFRIGNVALLIDKGRMLRYGEIGEMLGSISELEIEITTANRIDEWKKRLVGVRMTKVSDRILKAEVSSVEEIPELITKISEAGGRVINVNSLGQNISKLMGNADG